MSKATPRPWIKLNGRIFAEADLLDVDFDKQIADCFGLAGVNDVGNANAELIVKAVNAHDDLVSALEALASKLAETAQDESYMAEGIKELMQKAFTALAKAKG